MEKLKNFIKKLLIMTVTIMLLIGLASLSISSTSAETNLDSSLANENLILRQEYEKLATKLVEMEAYITEIHEYDNSIYAQMIGIDFDTTGFHEYFNDSISFAFMSNDSMFSNVDERALYAAEILATQLTKLQETSESFKTNKSRINYYPTISPVKTKDFICISSPFGFREHPIKGEVLYHEGIDISATTGTPVYSTAQGRVVDVIYSKYGYGNKIVIRHAYGFETLYAHLSGIKVRKGQWVNKNQIIGSVGNTGLSTGSHLHYEIHKDGTPRDPLGYFYISIGENLLVANQ